MTLVPTSELMLHAEQRRVGIGAFNVIHVETAEALASAAENARAPIILQISENCVRFHGGLEPIARAMLAVAEQSSAPIAVHLDHAEDVELVHEAIDLGFGSVMFDGAQLTYDDNVRTTTDIVALAHRNGVYVEAELGEIGGKDGAHSPGVRTDPLEAARFVERSGVDALAVAVGSSHAMTDRTAALDFELIRRLASLLPVPLVLHGSSGVSDESIVRAIDAGMRKINVSTHLNAFFTRGVRLFLEGNPAVVDSRKYIRAGRDELAVEATRLIRLFDRVLT